MKEKVKMLEMRSVTGGGRATDHPSGEHESETQSGGPEETGAPQVLFGFERARWGRKVKLFCAPINCCCFGGGVPEFGRFRERVAEPPGHLVC